MSGRPSPGARSSVTPRTTVCLLIAGALLTVPWLAPGPSSLEAQSAEAGDGLTKGQLIRLLAEPDLEPGAVADSVRRRCLSFRPAERDLRDLRELGADDEVVEAIEACGTSPEVAQGPESRPEPAASPTLAV